MNAHGLPRAAMNKSVRGQRSGVFAAPGTPKPDIQTHQPPEELSGMDLFEKFNRTFGSWYEGLFGGGDDVRPKDILRRIIAALEDHRKEGFDNRIYVPNQYVLEINVHDEEEKEYLLSFL